MHAMYIPMVMLTSNARNYAVEFTKQPSQIAIDHHVLFAPQCRVWCDCYFTDKMGAGTPRVSQVTHKEKDNSSSRYCCKFLKLFSRYINIRYPLPSCFADVLVHVVDQ